MEVITSQLHKVYSFYAPKATTTKVITDNDGSVSSLQVRSIDGSSKSVVAKQYFIAGGAVESARLLMSSKKQSFPDGICNHANHLGKYFNGSSVQVLQGRYTRYEAN